MPEPLAYFLTWTTYGTWLPGDDRGWVDKHRVTSLAPYEMPDRGRETATRQRLTHSIVALDEAARSAVDVAMRQTAAFRGWIVHALNVRTNHVHVVIGATGVTPVKVMRDMKAYASRALTAEAGKVAQVSSGRWWTKGGSMRYLNNEESVVAAVRYVESQDEKGTPH